MKSQNLLLRLHADAQALVWQSGLATAAALLWLLAFPPFELTVLGWFALVPLLWALTESVTLPRAAWLGWLMSVLFTFFAQNWIVYSMTNYGAMWSVAAYGIAFLFASVLALFPALFAVVQVLVLRRYGLRGLVFAPALWVATEYARPLVTGVTWNALGISQVTQFSIARLAQFGGVYLLSALLVAGSAFVTLLLRSRERHVMRSATLLVLFGACCFWLPLLQPKDTAPGITVNVLGVQPNIPVNTVLGDTERHLLKTFAMTRDAIVQTSAAPPDLIVWAECPLSLFYDNDETTRTRLNQLVQEINRPFILNTVARDEQERYFNSVTTITPATNGTARAANATNATDAMTATAPVQTLTRYDKIRLVPFGEYVPWRPLLGRFAPAITGDFTPGSKAVVNTLRLTTQRSASPGEEIERTTNYVKTGVYICYETAYPALVREFVRNGATLLVNVSEDGWFGPTFGPRQHLLHALMRAIETNRDVVRVTNTGISALLTADGQIIGALPQFTDATQRWQAHTRNRRTFYTQYGDWFALVCSAASLVMLGLSLMRRKPTQEN